MRQAEYHNGTVKPRETLQAFDRYLTERGLRLEAIVLYALGRADLLKTKLFALCDRGEDLDDCIALRPTPEELAEALPWVERQDANELWPAHVHASIADLARRIANAV